MKLLITGATGFVGRNLIKFLIKQEPSWQFVILTRNGKKAQKVFSEVLASSTSRICIINSIHDFTSIKGDILINLAGSAIFKPVPFFENIKLLYESRVKFSQTLITEMAQKGTLPQVIFSASSGIENGHDNFLKALRDAWENSIKDALYDAKKNKLLSSEPNTIFMRFSNIIGSDGGICYPYIKFPILTHFIPGDGKNLVSWISIQDVVKLIYELITKHSDFEGAINFSVPTHITIKELICSLRSHNNLLPTFMIPKIIIKALRPNTGAVLIDSNVLQNNGIQNLKYQYEWTDFKKLVNSWKQANN